MGGVSSAAGVLLSPRGGQLLAFYYLGGDPDSSLTLDRPWEPHPHPLDFFFFKLAYKVLPSFPVSFFLFFSFLR